MTKEKVYWIKNNHVASVKLRYSYKVGENTVEGDVVLAREATNRISGQVESRGYTPLTEPIYKALIESSGIFKDFLEAGKFIKYDDAPEDAYSDAERLVMLETRNAELEGLLGGFQAEVDQRQKDLEAITAERDKAKSDLEALTAEFEAYKKANPVKKGQAQASGS